MCYVEGDIVSYIGTKNYNPIQKTRIVHITTRFSEPKIFIVHPEGKDAVVHNLGVPKEDKIKEAGIPLLKTTAKRLKLL